MHIFLYFVSLIINIESVFLAIWWIYEQLLTEQTQQYMQSFTYLVLSIFTDLKLERIIGLPYLRI